MSQINLKSITGITSITTPAGVDNVFTVHTNDTTERFRVDSNGNQTAFSGANVITGQGGGAPTGTPEVATSGTVNNVSFTSGYSASEIDHDTGDVLYIENRTPIQRAPDQTENIKLVIEF